MAGKEGEYLLVGLDNTSREAAAQMLDRAIILLQMIIQDINAQQVILEVRQQIQ